jgi:hypothetical protein
MELEKKYDEEIPISLYDVNKPDKDINWNCTKCPAFDFLNY